MKRYCVAAGLGAISGLISGFIYDYVIDKGTTSTAAFVHVAPGILFALAVVLFYIIVHHDTRWVRFSIFAVASIAAWQSAYWIAFGLVHEAGRFVGYGVAGLVGGAVVATGFWAIDEPNIRTWWYTAFAGCALALVWCLITLLAFFDPAHGGPFSFFDSVALSPDGDPYVTLYLFVIWQAGMAGVLAFLSDTPKSLSADR